MKLYHCAKSRSVRVWWLLEELGLDYQLEEMPFDPKSLQSVDYLKINPFGKVPVLVDGALTMFESVAIVQYVIDRYGDGRLEPDRTSPAYGLYLQWLHFGESTMMGPVAEVGSHVFFLPEEQRNPAIAERGRKSLAHFLGILDAELASKEYLLGDTFTAADIVVGYTLFVCHLFKIMPDGCPHLEAYYDRLRNRPAFKTATR
jgi:glutathione S-transferase